MNKHTASVDGKTFKRNSKTRTYTHCVVGRWPLDPDWEAKARAPRKDDQANYEYLSSPQAYVAGGRPWVATFRGKKYRTPEEFLAAWPEFNKFQEQEAQERVDLMQWRIQRGDFELGAISWHGRYDLACQKANTLVNQGYVDVAIVAAQVK